jgi:hypothetical protein
VIETTSFRPDAAPAGLGPYNQKGEFLAVRALALIIILVGAILVVVMRVRRNTPGAIVAYAVLGIGLVLGLLSR